jgi:HAE1 family hydrophobic/amphiphilic exporter-1
MKISHDAIDRPRIVIVVTVFVVLLSIVATLRIAVQRSPAINTAIILIAVPHPGAQPTEVEEQITYEIETALQTLDNVDFIASSSMRGSSVTQVIFLDGTDGDQARADVEHLVNQIRSQLPVRREIQPIITKIDFESAPIMLVTLGTPDGFDQRALKEIAEDIQKDLEAIRGVANTQLFGGREREIHVDVNPDLAGQVGLTLNDVRNALMSAHVELAGGRLNSDEFEIQIVNRSQFRSADDIRNVVVAHRDGQLIRIADIAEVRDTYARQLNLSQIDGRDSATIVVNKETNINALAAAQAIKKRVQELRPEYPGISIQCTRDVSAEIGVMFQVLGSSAVFGALLVLIILAWTMGLRVSVLVLLAIPLSSAVALVFLFAAKVPISSMVIFSYILVLGMVVDGAIIVAENIHRHIERGLDPALAAKVGIDEVGIPVIAADLTTIAAFLPMLTVGGIMGDFMGVMPKVVSVALFGSVLVDHFLIPTLAAYWYAKGKPREALSTSEAESRIADIMAHDDFLRPNRGRMARFYERCLRYSLDHRWVVMTCCAMAICWAFAMIGLEVIKSEFFPSSDRGQFEINFELPLGYSIEQTAAAAKVFTEPLEKLKTREDGTPGPLLHFVTAIGSSGGLASRLETDPATGPEFGKIMVELVPPMDRPETQTEVINDLNGQIKPWPGMTYRIEEVEEGPPGGFDVAVRLQGKDIEQLGALATALKERLSELDGTSEHGMDYRPDSPQLEFVPRDSVLGLFDMTKADVARSVAMAVQGDTSIELSIDDEDVTLRLQVAPEYQSQAENISRLVITSPTGRRATVGQLAEVNRGNGLFSVNRYQRSRSVIVHCKTDREQGVYPDDIFRILRSQILPEVGFEMAQGDSEKIHFIGSPGREIEGVRATFTGENEERQKGQRDLLLSMLIGLVMIAGILVVQFNSFRQAVIVLISVPLSFVGVVAGMWICGFTFSLASMIGMVALTGIVVNDAIVMVDFTNQARKRGLQVKPALLEAGANRLRPVLLTTVTTIGGMLPLFLNISGGAEFWQPLTGAVIFGLISATLLTLVVVPVCYSLGYHWADQKQQAAG